MKFPCECGAALSVPDDWAGRQVRCSRCGKVTVVPAPASAQPQVVGAEPVSQAGPASGDVVEVGQQNVLSGPGDRPSGETPQVSAPVAQTTSGYAIASFVLGLAGCGCAFVGSLVAIVLGHVALAEIKKSEGRLGGRGLAIAGLVLGYVGLAAWIVYCIGLTLLLVGLPKFLR